MAALLGALFWITLILVGVLLIGTFYHDPNP